MLRLLTDEHIDTDLIRGLLAREPRLDILRIQDLGLSSARDQELLTHAALDGRVMVTHDRNTMTRHAYERVRAGQVMPGVIVVDDRLPIGRAIDDLLIVAVYSADGELADQVVYVPL